MDDSSPETACGRRSGIELTDYLIMFGRNDLLLAIRSS